MMIIFTGSALVIISWYFITHSVSESGRALITYALTMVMVLTAYYLMWKKKDIKLELLIIILLFIRIFFNLVVLPERMATAIEFEEKKAAEEIYEITQNSELMLHPVAPVSIKFVYYISTTRNEILRKEYGEFKNGTYYIFDARNPDSRRRKKGDGNLNQVGKNH